MGNKSITVASRQCGKTDIQTTIIKNMKKNTNKNTDKLPNTNIKVNMPEVKPPRVSTEELNKEVRKFATGAIRDVETDKEDYTETISWTAVPG